jgi:hypothetical protein
MVNDSRYQEPRFAERSPATPHIAISAERTHKVPVTKNSSSTSAVSLLDGAGLIHGQTTRFIPASSRILFFGITVVCLCAGV